MADARKDLVAAICWIVLGCAISIWSATFPFGTREAQGPAILPFGSGLAIVLLGGILLVQALRSGAPKEVEGPVTAPDEAKSSFARVTLCLGGMLAAAVLFDFLGFVTTMFCLILLLMRAIEPKTWRSDLFFTVAFTLGSYLLFQVALKTALPQGVLGF